MLVLTVSVQLLVTLKFEETLIIKAEKSYAWKIEGFIPKKMPFIPAFKLDESIMKNSSITKISDTKRCWGKTRRKP
mgnify:CR=1 FL=1